MLALAFAVSTVQANEADPSEEQGAEPFPEMRWTLDEAQSAGWSRAEIDIGAPGLDHATFMPPGAGLETAPFEEETWSGPGRLRNVAKIQIPLEFGEVDGTVTAFQTRATGCAVRLCAYLVAARGYEVDTADMADDQTRAQLLSFDEQDRLRGGMFTDCRTKGQDFLIHHFAFPVEEALEDAELYRRIDVVLDNVLPITSNLEFADGQPDGYGEAAPLIELQLGSTTAVVPVPTPMQVQWNDFEATGPTRELYLLQESDSPGVAIVWLGARDEPEEPDLAQEAPALAAHQFQLQSDGAPEPTLVFNEPIDASLNNGVAGQAIRFDVLDRHGEPGGSIEGESYWWDGRLYLVTWFTNIRQQGTASSLIARLPSQTAFDLVRHSLLSTFPTE